MDEGSVSPKGRLPLLTERSISVDKDGGSWGRGRWGGALAVFGFLGPETEAKAVMMEPMGSCVFGVSSLLFVVFWLTWDARFWVRLR